MLTYDHICLVIFDYTKSTCMLHSGHRKETLFLLLAYRF